MSLTRMLVKEMKKERKKNLYNEIRHYPNLMMNLKEKLKELEHKEEKLIKYHEVFFRTTFRFLLQQALGTTLIVYAVRWRIQGD